MGQRAALARVAQRLGGVRLGPTFALAETKEAAQRSQPAGDSRLGIALLVQARNVTSQINCCEPAWFRRRAVPVCEVRRERIEILAVALDRQRRRITLHAQVL